MDRGPSELMKMIATQAQFTARNPDREGGDSGPHHTTILDDFRRSGFPAFSNNLLFLAIIALRNAGARRAFQPVTYPRPLIALRRLAQRNPIPPLGIGFM